jgi:hypothetical protein
LKNLPGSKIAEFALWQSIENAEDLPLGKSIKKAWPGKKDNRKGPLRTRTKENVPEDRIHENNSEN